MKETREYLKHIGMPEGDLYSLPTSDKRFEDGGQYRSDQPCQHGSSVSFCLRDLPGSGGGIPEADDRAKGSQIHKPVQRIPAEQ